LFAAVVFGVAAVLFTGVFAAALLVLSAGFPHPARNKKKLKTAKNILLFIN
jgi:hypothetical protein